MSVIRSVIRSVTRPVVRSVISGGDSVIQRYFTPLNSTFQQYYEIPTVTLTGDFEISGGFYPTVDAAKAILGSSQDTQNNIILTAGGVLRVRINNNALDSTPNAFQLNKFNTYTIKRVGSVLTIVVNEALVGTKTNSSGSFPIGRIGTYSAVTLPFDGILANVSIIDAGTPIRLYPLDEDFSQNPVARNILDPSGATDGAAINIPDGDFYTLNSAGTIWTSPTGPDLEVA